MNTISEKIDELEALLLDSILEKARQQEPLTSVEMQLASKWLLANNRKGVSKGSNSPLEPLVTKGQPLPFLMERMSLEDAMDTLNEG